MGRSIKIHSNCSIVFSDSSFVNIDNVATGLIKGDENVKIDEVHTYYVERPATSTFNWFVDKGDIINGLSTNEVQIKWKDQGVANLSVQESTQLGCNGQLVNKPITIGPNSISENFEKVKVIIDRSTENILFNILNGSNYLDINLFSVIGYRESQFKVPLNDQKGVLNFSTFSAGLHIISFELENKLYVYKLIKY